MKAREARARLIEGPSFQVATFQVGAGTYGLDIMRIKEIIHPLAITAVPRAPGFVEGISWLRGAVVPIIDLRRRLDAPVTELSRAHKYVVVGLEGRVVGLIVDRVHDVVRVGEREVRTAPELAVGADARFFAGVIKRPEGTVMLLALDAILSSGERRELRGLDRVQPEGTG